MFLTELNICISRVLFFDDNSSIRDDRVSIYRQEIFKYFSIDVYLSNLKYLARQKNHQYNFFKK